MKLQVTLIAVIAVYLATIATTAYSQQEAHPSTAFLPLENVAPVEQHQPESFLEPSEGLVRNKRQFGYGGGYGRGFGGYGGRGYGGYGGRGYGGYGGYRGGYGGFRGGYGGYGR